MTRDQREPCSRAANEKHKNNLSTHAALLHFGSMDGVLLPLFLGVVDFPAGCREDVLVTLIPVYICMYVCVYVCVLGMRPRLGSSWTLPRYLYRVQQGDFTVHENGCVSHIKVEVYNFQ